jgi:hypothetical protein
LKTVPQFIRTSHPAPFTNIVSEGSSLCLLAFVPWHVTQAKAGAFAYAWVLVLVLVVVVLALFAVTESQCTEDEHDDDFKFRNLGLITIHRPESRRLILQLLNSCNS